MLAISGLLAALSLAGSTLPPVAPRPRLVVLIVVDQLRGDYIPRFQSQLQGGFARFLRSGAYFEQGRQDHAITETAPGHSTILSGRWPAHTGIVTNLIGVDDQSVTLLEVKDNGHGASPRRFRGTTLFDWLRSGDSGSRVLSVSRKDRGAILPVGRSRGDVYWFDSGIFTTSTWYRTADTLPGWVREFNAAEPVRALAGWTWSLLLPDSAYPEPDTVRFEAGGGNVTFPHQLSTNPEAAVLQIAAFPVMDSLTLAFALRGVERMKLGRGRSTDLLVVSLSTTDAVGHAYGPDSRELHDQILRVDRWLGRFMDSLGVMVPSDATVWALTGDHGVTSIPELAVERGQRAGRVWFGDLTREAEQLPGGASAFAFETGLLFGNVPRVRSAGVNVDSVAAAFAVKAAAIPGVARVFTPKTLRAAGADDTAAVLWRRTIPDDFAWLLCATLDPGFVWSPGRVIAEHGTTSVNDQWVPVAFLGAGVAAGRFTEPVSTTDIAPTLARLLGVRPTERLDGRVLTQALGPGAR
ncbi:MAG TPA: alkaline phosphatase family protein [Gemmatimonadales bacterium]